MSTTWREPQHGCARGEVTLPSRGHCGEAAKAVQPSGATKCYVRLVKTISQRELRNDNAAVVRGVEAGESYTITRRGVPVARLVPATEGTDLRCDSPAKKRPKYTSMQRVTTVVPTADLLDDLRGDR